MKKEPGKKHFGRNKLPEGKSVMKKIVLAVASIMAFIVLNMPTTAVAGDDENRHDNQLQGLFDEADRLYLFYDQDPSALDKGIELYLKALELAPENVWSQWRLAESYCVKADLTDNIKMKKAYFQEGLQWAEKTIAIKPKCAEAHFYVACAEAGLAEHSNPFSAISRIKRAKNELALVVELDQEGVFSSLAKSVLALIKAQAPWPVGNKDEALKLARQAVEERPNLTLARLSLAQAYASLGQKAPAVQAIDRCLAVAEPIYPSDAKASDWPRARKLLNELTP